MSDNPVLPGLLRSVAKLRHRQNTGTTDVGARQRINWVDSDVVYTITDSSINEEVTVTPALKATGPGVTGPIGSATVTPVITIDAQGRVTALTSASISAGTLGTLGYAGTTTAQTGITTVTDLTSLAVTVTVATGRRIRVTGWVQIQQNTSTGIAAVYIYESTTELQTTNKTLVSAAQDVAIPIVILTPSAGSHTYKLRANTTAGTLTASSPDVTPNWILVEDIGT